MVNLVLVLVSRVGMNGVIFLHVLACLFGPCLFIVLLQWYSNIQFSLTVCGDFILILYRFFEVKGMFFSWIFYTKIIKNKGEIIWATVVFSLSQSFDWGVLSIRFKVLFKGIMFDFFFLWEYIHSIGYQRKDVSVVHIVLDILCSNKLLWYHGYLDHY